MAPPYNRALIIPDTEFATLIEDREVILTGQDGIPFLFDTGNGEAYRLPPGIDVNPQTFGHTYSATVRKITGEVIFERGDDDIYEQELSHAGNECITLVDSWDDLKAVVDDLKIKRITRGVSAVGGAFSGALLMVLSFWFLIKGFNPWYLSNIGMFIGLTCFIYEGFFQAISSFRRVSSNVIGDELGNYINVETGMTNMNGGMRIPVER